jgi:hypothetical protein
MLGDYDMILGMSFRKCILSLLLLQYLSLIILLVRSVYTLFDYGNYVDDTSNDRGDPYVQLLSVTNCRQCTRRFCQDPPQRYRHNRLCIGGAPPRLAGVSLPIVSWREEAAH